MAALNRHHGGVSSVAALVSGVFGVGRATHQKMKRGGEAQAYRYIQQKVLLYKHGG